MPNTQRDLHKKLLGKKGEDLAVKFIKKSGYKLVKRNFSTPFGEADAIFEKDGVTVFVEVKTRSNDLFGEPKDSVGYKKQEKYKKIAEYYQLKHGEGEVSFAVAEVTEEGVNVITDAF
ncbi:MAG: YraN family protein [Clostridia bacterium]|nr:YraN family protein [Clostridia bacterium]